jgi:hypothetical protein
MSENKFITNRPTVLSTVDNLKFVQIGVVASVDDPNGLGRIKVKIPGPANRGGDDGTLLEDIPWAYPMVSKFFTAQPKIGEGVFILVFTDQKSHSDRLYFGPIISSLDNLNLDPVNTTALTPFTFANLSPKTNIGQIPALTGVFAKPDDIAIQGRYNTDILLRKNEVLIRAGKFIEVNPDDNNPYGFQFNTATPGFLQIRNAVPLAKPVENVTTPIGSVVNLVGSKVNILTHQDGAPRFNLTDQDEQITDDEMLNILENAHQLPFGDILIQYLRLLKTAFLNHVHNGNGRPPTDLVAGGAAQNVLAFKKAAEDLENRMLSQNVRIN